MVAPIFRQIEEATGTAPETCPWHAFHSPVVHDVLEVYPFFESGQLAFTCGPDPAHKLVQAVGTYHQAAARTRHWRWDLERKEQERKNRARGAIRG